MSQIVLISCASKKRNKTSKAKDLYQSTLFKFELEYAELLKPDKIYILSALHGVLELDDEVDPYNVTLNNMSEEERINWSNNVIKQLKNKLINFENDEFIILAGNNYRKHIIKKFKMFYVPMEGLTIGKQLSFLRRRFQMSKHCEKLHLAFSNMKRFTFPFDEREVPSSGIYILFEKDEIGHGQDWIVRVGTHTGVNQLASRLKEHFQNENKDRSIFRKNIGRCFLNKVGDEYLRIWEYDLTSRANKEKYQQYIQEDYQKKIEKQVSYYIQNNFSFVVINVENKEKRLLFERKLISEVSRCNECSSSVNWFGKFSTKNKIKESGLWQVNKLYKEVFTEKEFKDFLELIGQL